jgi:hypothetical protein
LVGKFKEGKKAEKKGRTKIKQKETIMNMERENGGRSSGSNRSRKY